MSDYVKTTNFTAKDSLSTGDAEKLILGSDMDQEFDDLAVASATKYDSGDIASQAQAQAGTDNTVLITPLRAEEHIVTWGGENGGMIVDIQALADPAADSILMWDDSANAIKSTPIASSQPLVITSTPDITFNISGLTAITGAGIAGVDQLYIDDGAGGTGKSLQYMDFGIPIDNKTDNYTTVLADGNRMITLSNAAAKVITIPANSVVAYPVGTMIIVLRLGAGEVDVAVTTDTVRAPVGKSNRARYSVLQITKIAATEWVVTGDVKA